jgi:hypothetical protein
MPYRIGGEANIMVCVISTEDESIALDEGHCGGAWVRAGGP